MNYKISTQRGVGLIEVLVSLVILAAGLLSVATLHVNIVNQSTENKTRSEAITIAESRIELMRNYSDGMTKESEFNAKFTNMIKGNSTNITGMNAAFTRMETIADANAVKDITVYVQWSDKENVTQEVMVSSSIGWRKPRGVADLADLLSDPLIPSATGRARLGDGTVTQDEYNNATGTGDGMKLFDSLDGDLRLVDEDKVIVLTLIDACDTDGGNCTDFVEISGRVYIDKTTKTIDPGDVFVKASDAAYCQQYYYVGGAPVTLSAGDTLAVNTNPANNYTYYEYTCYLGGGWHGNIGLILKGGISQSDKVCQGDPTSLDAFADPVISARRVYRGMVYAINADGSNTVDANGDRIYSSIGVSDALQLPQGTDSGHDFVLSKLGISDTTGDKCISEGVMVRADSFYDQDGNLTTQEGTLFQGVPTDFVCLNQNDTYIDNYDVNVFKHDNTCPFDPSDPPAQRHIISGQITIKSPATIDSDVALIDFNTSDGLGNCSRAAATYDAVNAKYAISYTCDVYDWGSGWNGYIQLNTDYSLMSCNDYRTTYADISSDTNATVNQCVAGNIVTFAGTMTDSTSGQAKTLTNVTINGGLSTQLCQFSDTSYSCSSDVLADNTLWSGTLTFVGSGGKLCIDTSQIKAHADFIAGTSSYVVTDLGNTESKIEFTNVDFGLLGLPIKIGGDKGECP